MKSLLIVSQAEGDRACLRQFFAGSDWRVHEADCCDGALELARENSIAVVICECTLPDGNWKRFLDEAFRMQRPPRVIVSSRLADEYLWAEVLNLGGYDVLMTPFDAHEVSRVAMQAWDSWGRAPWSVRGAGGRWAAAV